MKEKSNLLIIIILVAVIAIVGVVLVTSNKKETSQNDNTLNIMNILENVEILNESDVDKNTINTNIVTEEGTITIENGNEQWEYVIITEPLESLR